MTPAVPTIASVTALTCALVSSNASLALPNNTCTSSSTSASRRSSATTRLRNPTALASAASNGRQVITSSLAIVT